jgi:hypothetical protein
MAATRIYLAGPMSGIPYFNFPEFARNATMLRRFNPDAIVFSPAEKDNERHGVDVSADNLAGDASIGIAAAVGLNIRVALADDLTWICQHATHIALMKGWERSAGARVEFALACALKLEFIYL